MSPLLARALRVLPRKLAGVIAGCAIVSAVVIAPSAALASLPYPPTLTAATVNGASSVTVSPSASVAVAVTGAAYNDSHKWSAIKWGLSTGSTVSHCVDIDNIGAAASTTYFSVTAPASVGTYNLNLIGYTNATCSSNASGLLQLAGAVNIASDQTITVTTSAPASATYGDSFPVAVSASSGLPVAITTTGGCSISGDTVTMTSGTTACVVHYNQAGDGAYNPAPEVTETAMATKADATVSVSGWSGTYDGTSHGASGTATGVSGTDLAALLDLGSLFRDVAGGTADWTFSGGENYSDQSGSVAIAIAKRAITATAYGVNKAYDGTTAASVTLSTDALVGDDVSARYTDAEFASADAGTSIAVHVSGITLSGADAGNYSLTSDEADTSADITSEAATVTLDSGQDLDPTYDGAPKPLTFSTAPDGLHLAITYNGDASAPANAGTYAVVAAVDDPDAPDYAGSDTETLTIHKAAQTISFSPLGDMTFGDDDFSVAASASSGLSVDFAASGACTVSGGATIHLTGPGSCTITASQPGDGNYLAADDVAQSFAIAPPAQPTMGPRGAVFHGSIDVWLSANPRDSIHYAFGDSADCTSTTYTDTIRISTNTLLTAVACFDGIASDPVTASFNGASGGGGGGGGAVLGAEIGPSEESTSTSATTTPEISAPSSLTSENPASTAKPAVYGNGACTPETLYLTAYIKPGAKNDPAQVKLLQQFLNGALGLHIPLTGFYGPLSLAAVKQFQNAHADEILKPWADAGFPANKATGYVYKTTLHLINVTRCGLPMDALPYTLP